MKLNKIELIEAKKILNKWIKLYKRGIKLYKKSIEKLEKLIKESNNY